MSIGENEPTLGQASGDDAGAPPVRLRRIRHPWRAAGFAVVAAVLLAAAFVAGGLVRSPDDEALEAARETIPVTAAVEERVVADAFAIPAVVVPGATADVVVTEASTQSSAQPAADPSADAPAAGSDVDTAAPAQAERVLVTANGVAVGERTGYGRLLAEVSGRPVFAIPSHVPLFRDLAPGDSGNDVRALQQLLLELGYGGGRTAGVVDDGTLAALGRLYRDAGYTLPYVAPGVQGVAWREFAAVPSAEATVLSVAPVGAALAADVPLVRLETSAPTLSARVTVLERERFAEGSPIGVSAGGAAPVQSTVLGIGEFGTDATTGVSGNPITVAVPDGVPLDGSVPLQLVALDTPPPSPAVPAVAVRQEGGASYVVLAPDDAADDPQPTATDARVPVTVTAQADGWVAIEPHERLPAGTRVLIE